MGLGAGRGGNSGVAPQPQQGRIIATPRSRIGTAARLGGNAGALSGSSRWICGDSLSGWAVLSLLLIVIVRDKDNISNNKANEIGILKSLVLKMTLGDI